MRATSSVADVRPTTERFPARARGHALLLALVGAIGCQNGTVVIPANPQDDQAPTITVVNFVPGSTGEVDKPEVGASSTVYATIGTQLILSAHARNPAGGVKSFSLTITQGGVTLYQVATSSVPDANHKAPVRVSIVGGDGQGGAGSAVALLVSLSGPATLVAKAENFHGMATSITVTYLPLGPVTAQLNLTPTSVAAGTGATLTWNATNATAAVITPPVTAGPLPLAGSVVVAPGVTTTYTLTASQPFAGPTATFVNPPWVGPPFVGPPPGNSPLQTTGETQQPTSRTTQATLSVASPPPETGGIAGAYYFDVLGTQRPTVTVVVTGVLVTPIGTSGMTSFALPPISKEVLNGPQRHVNFMVSGLRKGTWSVTAKSDIAGPRTCAVVVPPGLTTLSVAANQAPCWPP